MLKVYCLICSNKYSSRIVAFKRSHVERNFVTIGFSWSMSLDCYLDLLVDYQVELRGIVVSIDHQLVVLNSVCFPFFRVSHKDGISKLPS